MDALVVGIVSTWILDADIRSFFDEVAGTADPLLGIPDRRSEDHPPDPEAKRINNPI
jgi:hypothetical protein